MDNVEMVAKWSACAGVTDGGRGRRGDEEEARRGETQAVTDRRVGEFSNAITETQTKKHIGEQTTARS